ncbi:MULTISPECIES: DUF1176 domain-containing protein [unclassified Brevundimonas]|uniref:DUF1176 domain-containing protein n=1 Tax=unclassified Brevundimonas TaxID=2622653 RepID=UPI0025B9A934|nr:MULTISPECIES: DUF1176 domain-containing protein [unclassified Brevundimonas]
MTSKPILLIGTAAAVLLAGCNQAPTENTPATEAPSASEAAAPVSATAGDEAAPQTTGFASETKTFREWTAVCDNVNNCAAYGPANNGNGYVMVQLSAGPAARPHVLAGTWDLPAGSSRLLLNIDGLNYAGKMEQVDSETPMLSIEAASDQLIRAIANGRAMTLAAGDEKTQVTLTGAAAALLWIDERQGRLGSTTALVRKGDRAASTVPAALARPRIQAAAAIAQSNLPSRMPAAVANLQAVRECAENDNTSDRWEVHRLGSDTLLWSVPCGAGAYNFSRSYVTSANDGSNARLVNFATTGETSTQLVNSEYDPRSRTVTAFSKARGIGDCGQAAEWVWTGRNFSLLSELTMTDCLGMYFAHWPSTYSATL